jgi:hypothetical protein
MKKTVCFLVFALTFSHLFFCMYTPALLVALVAELSMPPSLLFFISSYKQGKITLLMLVQQIDKIATVISESGSCNTIDTRIIQISK